MRDPERGVAHARGVLVAGISDDVLCGVTPEKMNGVQDNRGGRTAWGMAQGEAYLSTTKGGVEGNRELDVRTGGELLLDPIDAAEDNHDVRKTQGQGERGAAQVCGC